MWPIFKIFLLLGLTSFGGPAAHLGYFHRTFVDEKKWLTKDDYSQLLALSQLLPGPGSSQVCFAIGLQRAGLLGAISAFIAFTLPSFVIMVCLALFYGAFNDNSLAINFLTALKLVAVVVVIDAVYAMFCHFCQTKVTQSIFAISVVSLLTLPSIYTQIIVLVLAAVFGIVAKLGHQNTKENVTLSLGRGGIWFLLFSLLFILSFIPFESSISSLFARYFNAGSLVFGGGHVVLPLLQTTSSAYVSTDAFMAGYAAAQGIPGPMFTFASYLGAVELINAPLLGAIVATLAIFLPGFMLMLAFLPSWQQLSAHRNVAGAIVAINAAVVGLLFTALYQPLFVNAVTSAIDLACVVGGLFIVKVLKWSILRLILLAMVSAALTTFI